MKNPPVPSNENERLNALKEYQILDTLSEQAYDDITKIASQICSTPIALISLIDEDRQWFKSHYGLDVKEAPRKTSYCAHTINEPNEIMEVPDACQDERFHDNPLVIGEPYIRFYAGVPLTDNEGHALGTLCVIDHKEKSLTQDQKNALQALSRQVVILLQLRKENLKRSQIDRDFNQLVENLGDGVFELNENGHCTYANSKMLQMLRRSLKEVTGSSIWDMVYLEDMDKMKTFYNEQFKKRIEKCSYEYRLQPKKSEPIWVSQNTTMEYEGSRMIKLRSISRDISQTKTMEKELAIKESLYKLVTENSTDLIALHKLDGTYKFVSPSAQEILGYTEDELIGKSPYEYIHPEDINRLKKGPHKGTLGGDSIQNIEYRLKRKDESFVWMESYTKPIFTEKGEVVSFQTSSRDISEKKVEEIRINKHMDGLTLLNELAGLPSNTNDLLNSAIWKVTKYLGMDIGIISQIKNNKYLVKHHFSETKKINHLTKYPVPDNSCYLDTFQKSVVILNNNVPYLSTHRHPCFRTETVNTYVGACIIKSGEKYGTIDFLEFEKSAHDFTNYDKEFLQLFANWIGSVLESQEEKQLLRKARKHAEAASEAKNNFLSMISHEIRTPLNGIVGTTHLLLTKSPDKEQITYLKVLEQSSNNLMAIVNDILDFNKIEEGKIQLDESLFNLNQLVIGIFENYKIQGDDKGIKVSFTYDETMSQFYICDSVRISQILYNLLSNAVKFTNQGSVTLNVTKLNSHDDFDEIEFKVTDSGTGIPKKKQEEIFNVFTQADKSITREFGGSGLGLAISKKLLKLMNSDIQLESTVGLGSIFSFKLVLKRASEKKEQEASIKENKFKLLKATVLLVEDNDFNRAIAKDFLESWACEVLEACDGKKAMELLHSDLKVDLVLLDLQMPVMDGYETIKAIRSNKNDSIRNLPVIALTATALGEVENKVFQFGMDGFITKPFHPLEFYQKMYSQLYPASKNIRNNDGVRLIIINKLKSMLGSDEKQIDKYFNVFVEKLKEEHEVLKVAINTGNFPALRAYAHKNKSSLSLGGLQNLGDEAGLIEGMIDRKSPNPRILEKAMNHQKEIERVLEKLI